MVTRITALGALLAAVLATSGCYGPWAIGEGPVSCDMDPHQPGCPPPPTGTTPPPSTPVPVAVSVTVTGAPASSYGQPAFLGFFQTAPSGWTAAWCVKTSVSSNGDLAVASGTPVLTSGQWYTLDIWLLTTGGTYAPSDLGYSDGLFTTGSAAPVIEDLTPSQFNPGHTATNMAILGTACAFQFQADVAACGY